MSRHTLRAIVLAAVPFVLASCSSSGETLGASAGGGRGERAGGRGAGAPVPVVTAQAVRKAVPVTIPAVGTVEAISSVEIRSQITGQVTAVHFTEGREVRQGQPLFSLDPRPFQTALQQAQAVLARDTATLKNAEAAQARLETLFQRGLVSKDQYESQRASATALAATVDADKAAAETARLNLQYTEISAPITGRTGSLGTHVGDLVRANDATPLVVIVQLSPVYVAFSVPGRSLSEIRRYHAQSPLWVTATAPDASSPGAPQAAGAGGGSGTGGSNGAPAAAGARGRVTFIDNAVDVSTGTIRLKGTFPNADLQLWPGAFVQVTLDLTVQPDAVVVPATAVQTSQDGKYVYLVKPDRTVDLRVVSVERQQGSEVVVTEGLAPGDEVVTDGHLRLTPGAPVSVGAGAGAGSDTPPPAGRGR